MYLSYGNATVQSGFSVNPDVLVEKSMMEFITSEVF